MDLLMVLRKATFSVAVIWVIGMLLAIHNTRQFYLYKMRRIDEPKKQFDRTLRPIFHTSRKNSFDMSDSLASKGDGLKFRKSSENQSAFIDDGNLHENELPYIQTGTSDLYMFSAVQIQSGDAQNKEGWTVNGVVVNGWGKRNLERPNFLCCYYLSNGLVSSEYSRRKIKTWNGVLRPVMYVCPVVVGFSHLRGVSITMGDSCSTNKNHYIKPVFQIESIKSEIAICSKMTFRSISAEQILEWFEVQRLLGVSKILTYTYRLNFEALKVLKYYESIGLATVVYDFDFPEKDEYPRDVGQRNHGAWRDLQLVMNDCYIRLYGYKYVMVLDKDEFMIPNVTRYGFDLKLFLDSHFLDNTAGITMYTKMHMTPWNPTNQSSTLLLEKYINSTAAIRDRLKHVFMPTRVTLGSVRVHDYSPAPHYRRRFLQATEISLHHYRRCRSNYWFEKGIRKMTARELSVIYENKAPDKKCFGFRQYDSPDVRRVIHAVKSNVFKLGSELNVKI